MKLLGLNDSVELVEDCAEGKKGTKAKVLCFNANQTITIKVDESGDVTTVKFEQIKKI